MKRKRNVFPVAAFLLLVPVCISAQLPVFRSKVREVSVIFRVLDKQNHLVSGIDRDEIRIHDEGIERKITSFSGNVSYSQIVVASDVSGSMAEVLEPLRGALTRFADLVANDSNHERGDVLLTLLPFSESARVLVDKTPDPAEFKNAVARLRPSGSTALVDAILSTLLNAFGPPSSGVAATKRSKFLVVFTDAGENSSGHQWADIASAVLGREIVIFSVIFDSGTPDANVPKLAAITRDSGGEVFRAKVGDLDRVYAQIAKNIRGHYALTFDASDVENSQTWRNVRISTTRPGLTVLSTAGYCPETPCQKTDGTFVGGTPKNWNQVLSVNRDPAVVESAKEQLGRLSFAYTAETSRIVDRLSNQPLLVERRWNTRAKESKPYFVSQASGAPVGIDTEACGIMLAPKSSPTIPLTSGKRPILNVAEPEIRVSRRPAARSQSTGADDEYFQTQAIFYLVDPSGGIAHPLKVQCNRPHYLVGNGLVEFAGQAVAEALKLTPLEPATKSGSK